MITVSVDNKCIKGIIPYAKRKKETIAKIQYETLINNPFKYTEYEFQKEVHHNKRGKAYLNIDKYDIRRSELCKKYGWGIYINKEGKLALVGCETDKYRELENKPSVMRLSAYKKRKR